MKPNELAKEIKKLDRTTDEFSELFHVMNEMYFTFNDPDEFQTAASVLNLCLHREGAEWLVEILAKLAQNLFEVVHNDVKATHGNFQISGTDYFFDIYQNKDALKSVHAMFRNVILKQASDPSNSPAAGKESGE